MRRLETRLEGPILLEPAVHGDERGFFLETARAGALAELGISRRVRAGQPVALEPRRAARDALPAAGWRSWCAARAAGSSTWSWTSGPLAAVRALGGLELDDESHHQLYCPDGFAHGFCVLSRRRRRGLPLLRLLRPGAGARLRFDDPGSGSMAGRSSCGTSERDANAPLLAELRERARALSGPAGRALARAPEGRARARRTRPSRPSTPTTPTAATAGSVSGSSPNRIPASAPASSAPSRVGGGEARRTRSDSCTPGRPQAVRSRAGTRPRAPPAVATAGPSTPSSGVRISARHEVERRGARERQPGARASPAPTRKPGVTISAP